MLQVVIVGDRDSGKTTFLGLLYATQVRSGSDKTDNLRFHAPFESLEAITLLFQQLMSGSFPDPVTKQAVNEISFQVGYRRAGLGILRRARGWAPGASSTLRFTLMRTQREEISRLYMGSSVADETLKNIHDIDAVAILVDSTKLAVKGELPEPGPMSRFDGAIESLLTFSQRLREPGRRRLLQPIFIFSKFDRVRPEVLRAAKVGAAPPPIGRMGPRAAYAGALLDHNLPRTFAKIRAGKGGEPRFAKPAYFFSWVRTEDAAPGQPERIRLRRSDTAGWGLDYSSHECLAFLGCLGDIAVRSGR